MNITQIKAVFDSFDIISKYSGNYFTFKDNNHNSFGIQPTLDGWFNDNPPHWKIFRTWPELKLLTTVNDEFELQDWLISEYPTY